MQSNTASGDTEIPLLWNAAKELQDGFNGHLCSLPYLLGVAQNLQRTLEDTRQMYNTAIKQRDEARTKLIAAQNSLAAVERVVGQYATVKDPVVASDGFTYENVSICEYLMECAGTNTKAYSQLTKEELLDVVVPNQTLRRLVHMLQLVRTSEVPPVSQRSPIAPFTTKHGEGITKSTSNGLNWADEENDPVATPIRVSELEATLVNAANVSSLNASQSSTTVAVANNSNNNNSAVSANNSSASRRWDSRQQQQSGGTSNKNSSKKHPCLRVYGRCNFLDDCAFAHYPYEACLNYIKGKCRFGQHCKELHVSSTFPRYGGQRGSVNHNSHNTAAAAAAAAQQGDEKGINARGKRNIKDKESSKGSSMKDETGGKETEEERCDVKAEVVEAQETNAPQEDTAADSAGGVDL